MKLFFRSLISLITITSISLTLSVSAKDQAYAEVVSVDELDWGYLNPARGDKGPSAADLWGDRTKDKPSGILLKFPEGFSSPSHIHNITYRGVVIKGQLHNDDPTAKSMWLPSGSFWTQPAGENHITAANGEENIAYIEIDSGPYFVQPADQAFDNGERPIKVDSSNLVWQNASNIVGADESDVKIAYLWGDTTDGKPRGSMLKLPANFKGTIEVPSSKFKAIVIQGKIDYAKDQKTKELLPGSYFGSKGKFIHNVSSASQKETVLYTRGNGGYRVLPN